MMLFSFRCYADEPRYRSEFKSDNGIFTLKVSELKKDTIRDNSGTYEYYSEVKWGLYKLSNQKPLYEIPGPISQRTAYISDDGRYVVVINDWPPEQANDSLQLILVYVNGNLLNSFSLSDIYKCGYNISSSVSHFSWSWSDIKVNFTTNIISFKTYELVDFRINITAGKIIEKQLDRRINDSTIFVYGKVFGEKSGGFRIEVCHRVYGVIDSTGIAYFSSDYKYHGGWYYSVLINEGKEERIRDGLSDIHDIILNSCLFDFEKLGVNAKPIGFGNINCR
jgi:hypothetical protein